MEELYILLFYNDITIKNFKLKLIDVKNIKYNKIY